MEGERDGVSYVKTERLEGGSNEKKNSALQRHIAVSHTSMHNIKQPQAKPAFPSNQKAGGERGGVGASSVLTSKGLGIKCTHTSQSPRQPAGGSYYIKHRMRGKKIIKFPVRHINSILSFRGNYLNAL